MKMLMVLLTLTFISNIACENDDLVLIKDFLLRQTTPTHINAFLCWNKVKTLQLLKILFENNFRVSILNFDTNLLSQAPPEYQLFLIDLTCNDSEAILTMADEAKLFRHPYRWLALTENSGLEMLENFNINIDSRFFISDSNKLRVVYKLGDDSHLLLSDVGKWTRNNSFDYFNELMIYRDRLNFKGMKLNVSTIMLDMDSLNHIRDYKNPRVDQVSRSNYIFCQHLAQMLNISLQFNYQTIAGERNGTTSQFTGMLGSLQRGEAELGGTAAIVSKDSLSVVDYISPTPTRICFVYRAPPLSYVQNIFILPFARSVWISFFGLTFVTVLVLFTITFYEWKNPIYLDQSARLHASIPDAVMVQIGGMCQQGSDTEPVSQAGRIALIVSFIALMFLYTSFSANIVLLLQTSSNRIKSVDDLLRSSIKIGAEDTPINRHTFAMEYEPVRKTLYQEKIVPKGQQSNFMSLADGIARMREEFFAFYVDVTVTYHEIADTFFESEKCGLREVLYVRPTASWMPIRKNSPFKEILKVASRQLFEAGMLDRDLSRFIPKRPTCGAGGGFVTVGLIDCYAGYLIFGFGAGCATGLLILEVIIGKYYMSKKKEKI